MECMCIHFLILYIYYTFVTWNTVHRMIELHIDSTTKFLLMDIDRMHV